MCFRIRFRFYACGYVGVTMRTNHPLRLRAKGLRYNDHICKRVAFKFSYHFVDSLADYLNHVAINSCILISNISLRYYIPILLIISHSRCCGGIPPS